MEEGEGERSGGGCVVVEVMEEGEGRGGACGGTDNGMS
jgi:hypothetical protein